MKKFFDREFDLWFAVALLVGIFWAAWDCLDYPPLSDSWEMLYSYHHLDKYPGSWKWLHVFNLDPLEKMRFQPLAMFFYYALHLVFGSRFVIYKTLNLLFYYMAAWQIYRFSLRFCPVRVLSAAAVTAFVFAFNHFDIVLWSSHMYVVFAVWMFFWGFNSFFERVDRSPGWWMLPVGVAFWLGMLCYEAYFFWPLGILACAYWPYTGGKNDIKARLKNAGILLAGVYAAYVGMFFFCRALGTYPAGEHSLSSFFMPENFVNTVFITAFNYGFNNVLAHLWPFVYFPLFVSAHIYMGGDVFALIERGVTWFVFLGGGVVVYFLWQVGEKLHDRGDRKYLGIFCFLVFLLFSNFGVIVLARLGTNEFVYSMTEFRYQYAANAVSCLLLLFFLSQFWNFAKGKKRFFAVLLLLVVSGVNIFASRRVVDIYNSQLHQLIDMYRRIDEAYADGRICPERKLFIDQYLPDYLPNLCWNIRMGMWVYSGSYQWLFSARRLKSITTDRANAYWVIDRRDFFVIKNTSDKGGAARVDLTPGRFYTEEAKSKQFFCLAGEATVDDNFVKAGYCLVRSIMFTPRFAEKDSFAVPPREFENAGKVCAKLLKGCHNDYSICGSVIGALLFSDLTDEQVGQVLTGKMDFPKDILPPEGAGRKPTTESPV